MQQGTDSGGVVASVVVPTRNRPGYLEVTLSSVAPQCQRLGAELIVVDDGQLEDNRNLAQQHGARYLSNPQPSGANVARNIGIRASSGDLIVLIDDDIRADPNWLASYLEAAKQQPNDFAVFGGPIRPSLEGPKSIRLCGNEPPMFTNLDLGPEDREAELVWSANMMLRRYTLKTVGYFDEALAGSGEEEEWVRSYRRSGGRVLYVADAAVDHRRVGSDAGLKSLAASAYGRGRDSLRYDRFKKRPLTLRSELRILAGCLFHSLRYRCSNGLVMFSHSGGRVRELLKPAPRDPSVVGVKRSGG